MGKRNLKSSNAIEGGDSGAVARIDDKTELVKFDHSTNDKVGKADGDEEEDSSLLAMNKEGRRGCSVKGKK